MAEKKPPVILLADDNAQQLQLFYWPHIEAACPPGTMLISATNSYDAKELIAKYKPDIVLLDVIMPATDFDASVPMGQEYAHSLSVAQASREANPDSKVILLSSYAEQHMEHYPPGSMIVHPHEYKAQLQPALARALQEKDGSVAVVPVAAVREPSEHHTSRIEQVRRSPWHNGSREGCDDSWAINVTDSNSQPRKR